MSRISLDILTGNLLIIPSEPIKSWIKEDWNNEVEDAGGGAESAVEYGQKVFKFAPGLEQCLRAKIKVPTDYKGGQLFAVLSFYSPSVVNNFDFTTTTFLQRSEIDGADEDANFYNSTNNPLTNVVPSNKIRTISFDLTNENSMINGFAVSADDILDIRLRRETLVNDDLDDLRFIPYGEIVKV